MINFFAFKDRIPIFLRSGIVYKFKSGGCNVLPITAKLSAIFKSEHLGLSVLTGKKVKGDNKGILKEHYLFCNDSSGFEDFPILATFE